MNNTSIKVKFIMIFSGIIFAIATFMSLLAVYTIHDLSSKDIAKFSKSKYADKTSELQHNVEIVMSIIEYHYKSNNPNKKAMALDQIKKVRYGTSGYFWIHGLDLKMIMHPMKPSLNGKDISGVKDPTGKAVFVAMNEVIKNSSNGGKVSYMWPKPNEKDPKEKFSYVKKFEPWGWVIGAGTYVDDVEKDIAVLRETAQEEIIVVTTTMIIFAIIILIVAYFITVITFNKLINEPLSRFKKYFNNFLKFISMEDNRFIQAKIVRKDEIEDLMVMLNNTASTFDAKLKSDVKVMGEVVLIAAKVEQGIYRCRVNARSQNPMIMTLKDSLNSLLTILENNMNTIDATLDSYSHSDFTKRIQIDSKLKENMLAVMNGVNTLGKTLEANETTNLTNGKVLEENSTIMTKSMENLATKANEQAASLEEVSASLEEITSLTRNTSKNASQMSKLGQDVQSSVSKGHTLASNTANSMQQINEKVSAILESINSIDQIAFQTNILSLNAAVEAATAGEAGKGFAVVAQEVRNLASRSAEAAKDIKDLVETASHQAVEGKNISASMIEGYEELNTHMQETIKLIQNVSSASQEQISGIEQINHSVSVLDKMTQENANEATNVKELSDGIKSMAEELVANK